MAELPVDLLADSLWAVGGGKPSCLRGVRGGTKGVRAHVRDGGGLPGRSGGSRCCRSAHLTCGATIDETAADLFGDAKLATGKGSRPGDASRGRLSLELPPRTTPAPARRSPPPTPRRSDGQLHSASAENPHSESPSRLMIASISATEPARTIPMATTRSSARDAPGVSRTCASAKSTAFIRTLAITESARSQPQVELRDGVRVSAPRRAVAGVRATR